MGPVDVSQPPQSEIVETAVSVITATLAPSSEVAEPDTIQELVPEFVQLEQTILEASMSESLAEADGLSESYQYQKLEEAVMEASISAVPVTVSELPSSETVESSTPATPKSKRKSKSKKSKRSRQISVESVGSEPSESETVAELVVDKLDTETAPEPSSGIAEPELAAIEEKPSIQVAEPEEVKSEAIAPPESTAEIPKSKKKTKKQKSITQKSIESAEPETIETSPLNAEALEVNEKPKKSKKSKPSPQT